MNLKDKSDKYDELVQVSLKIPKTLLEEVNLFGRTRGATNQTGAINLALKAGLISESELSRVQRLFELTSLKTLYTLRQIARERGEDFITGIDAGYEVRRQDIEQMILEFGVDYDGS